MLQAFPFPVYPRKTVSASSVNPEVLKKPKPIGKEVEGEYKCSVGKDLTAAPVTNNEFVPPSMPRALRKIFV